MFPLCAVYGRGFELLTTLAAILKIPGLPSPRPLVQIAQI
jgi:hypothetical protein